MKPLTPVGVLLTCRVGGGDFGGIDFSKLGGGGMPDMGGEDEEDEGDESDDELPGLVEETPAEDKKTEA